MMKRKGYIIMVYKNEEKLENILKIKYKNKIEKVENSSKNKADLHSPS